MLIYALILSSLLLHKFVLRVSHGINFGSLLLFQVALYIYRHAFIVSFSLLFLSWETIYAIIKVITSSPLSLTNQRRHYHFIYGI